MLNKDKQASIQTRQVIDNQNRIIAELKAALIKENNEVKTLKVSLEKHQDLLAEVQLKLLDKNTEFNELSCELINVTNQLDIYKNGYLIKKIKDHN